MTLEEIKQNIEKGNRVFQNNDMYEVIKDKIGQYLIYCKSNGYCIGLTHRDGITMNGDESDFYIKSLD